MEKIYSSSFQIHLTTGRKCDIVSIESFNQQEKPNMKEKLDVMPEEKTKAFAEAVKRIELQTVEACRIFGCTRQTFANWMTGRTRVPDAAFLALIRHENQRYRMIQERCEEIDDVLRRLNGK